MGVSHSDNTCKHCVQPKDKCHAVLLFSVLSAPPTILRWSLLALFLLEGRFHYTELKPVQTLQVTLVYCASQKAGGEGWEHFLPDRFLQNLSVLAKIRSRLSIICWTTRAFHFDSRGFLWKPQQDIKHRVSWEGYCLFCIFLGWFWNWSVTQKRKG